KGDNFVGNLIAYEVKVKDVERNDERVLHWMCKTMRNEMTNELMEKFQLFEREEGFYNSFQRDLEKYVGHNLLRTVPLIYSQNEPGKELLIFEHMGHQGYRDPLNKKEGLSSEAIFAALRWLAELHGAGHLLLRKYPGGFEEWKKNNFYVESIPVDAMGDINQEMATNAFLILEDMKNGSENDALVDDFYPKLKGFYDNLPAGVESMGEMLKKCLYDPRMEFKTLTHGDPWFNNLMVKYGSGNSVEDLIFLDMQVISSGNIGEYWWDSSPYEDLSPNFDKYLKHYVNCLSEFVMNADPEIIHPPLSFDDVKNDFLSSALVGFHFALNSFPHVLVDKEDVLDTSNIDWSKPEELRRFNEMVRANSKRIMNSKPPLYDRLIGAIKFMLEIKAFDHIKH
ncbi:Putative LOC101895777, partial [Caligus rogercresseyi]